MYKLDVDPSQSSIIIVAGVSGAGKSTIVNVLEDQGFTCIENLPCFLLVQTIDYLKQINKAGGIKAAISLSSDSLSSENLTDLDRLVESVDVTIQRWFVTADPEVLLARYGETRRRHPFSVTIKHLPQAIKAEVSALAHYAQMADYTVDTTTLSVQKLKTLIVKRLQSTLTQKYSSTEIHLFSFGFKYGMPKKADYIFDVRCLPNPYWDKALRAYSGQDAPVIDYLSNQDSVEAMIQDIALFLNKWCIQHQAQGRDYIEIGIGCTGGQHRSVFIVDRLEKHLGSVFADITVTHRELGK
ncbi:RNase adapter RapZ [Facilibium subflavum]|uniref:RNase adapter RapZ n=1 Tax=Facilibium subflavum TaxID=2219058 RepID=UPI000E647393|nr:RNase adapter RapZ [Facilibium subflavum]